MPRLFVVQGYDIPLVADIHFQPQVAMLVADAFEKIRINPGNFVDGRKTFNEYVYDSKASLTSLTIDGVQPFTVPSFTYLGTVTHCHGCAGHIAKAIMQRTRLEVTARKRRCEMVGQKVDDCK